MKKRITDILDNLPVEILGEIHNSEANKESESFLNRKKKLIIIIAALVVIMAGCTAYVAIEMPLQIKAFFSDSSEKLVDELYLGYTDYVDYENYRLAVEGIVSDVDSKKILISVTAITEKAKENFSIETCPTPIIVKGDGSGGMMSSYISADNKYKMEFYYEIESSAKECMVILNEGSKNKYEFYDEDFGNRLNELAEKLMNKKGYSMDDYLNSPNNEEIRNAFEEAYDLAFEQTLKEKAGKILTFSIASKENKEIKLEINQNNVLSSFSINKIKITRSTISLYGKGIYNESGYVVEGLELMEFMPTIFITYSDGTQELLVRGTMGYETDINNYDITESGGGYTFEDSGNFIIKKDFSKPIDLDKITKIKVNEIEYLVNE